MHLGHGSVPRLLVAVVGGSGSGKSWLAGQLARRLRGQAVRVSQDDFYLDRAHLSEARRVRLNFDHPRAIDWVAFEKVLRGLKTGHTVLAPAYDFRTHCRKPGLRTIKPAPIILVEGLWLLRNPRLRRLFGLKIFIECARGLRLKRRLRRDRRARGRTSASVLEQFHATVEPMHERWVAPQARWADRVLRGEWGHAEAKLLGGELRALVWDRRA